MPALSSKAQVTPVRADAAAIIDDVGGSDNVRLALLSAIEDLFNAPEINTQAPSSPSEYTLVLGDAGKIVEMNKADANVLIIPLNSSVAYPIGTLINVTQLGAGITTVRASAGVTLNGTLSGSPIVGAAISAQYGGVSLYKRGTNEWIIQGAHGGVA